MNERIFLPAAQHDGVVLAGVKAEPSGWPPASLDTSSGRHPRAATGEDPTKSGLYDPRGLTDWHQRLGSGVHADAIMDRIVHNTIWIETGSTNMREHAAITAA